MDARQKVTGEARSSEDLRTPDMLFAAILPPPAHDAIQKKNKNLEPAKKTDGINLIREEDLIVALHQYPDVAPKVLSKIKVAAVNVDETAGEIAVQRVVCAQNTGEVINPNGVKLQMGAVIANAVYEAIGVRLYELPMTPARGKNAIKNHLAEKSDLESKYIALKHIPYRDICRLRYKINS
ncbi:MAG: molybdopterin-dependent oxidoreductase [Desulfobacterales bacterium]